MTPTERPLVIFVDVDDTFMRSFGTKRIAVPAVIEHIRNLHISGAALYCWSSGGADYAKASAMEFGIAECFIAFLPKPQVILDDQSTDQWRYLLQLHPNSTPGRTMDDYRHEMRDYWKGET